MYGTYKYVNYYSVILFFKYTVEKISNTYKQVVEKFVKKYIW